MNNTEGYVCPKCGGYVTFAQGSHLCRTQDDSNDDDDSGYTGR